MPYVVDGKCVYKKKPDGSRGEKVGCTDGSVKDYLAALHANANESIEETYEREELTENKKMKISKERLKKIIQEELSKYMASTGKR
jgi:hypothetical protein